MTCLASSYGLLVLRITRTLTRKLGDDLTLGYLESMCVANNEGLHWSISRDDDLEYQDQPTPQQRPRGQRNVRARGEVDRDRQAAQQHAGVVPTNPFQSWVDTYLDNLRGNAN